MYMSECVLHAETPEASGYRPRSSRSQGLFLESQNEKPNDYTKTHIITIKNAKTTNTGVVCAAFFIMSFAPGSGATFISVPRAPLGHDPFIVTCIGQHNIRL